MSVFGKVTSGTPSETGVVMDEDRKGEPHSEQNFDVGRASAPHFEQQNVGAAI